MEVSLFLHYNRIRTNKRANFYAAQDMRTLYTGKAFPAALSASQNGPFALLTSQLIMQCID